MSAEILTRTLRVLSLESDRLFRSPPAMTTAPQSKASLVRDHMASGRWDEAIRLAASFARLDKHREAILDARTAYTNPRWLTQLGIDPEAAKLAGHAALRERFA